jgi:hypothetical protein
VGEPFQNSTSGWWAKSDSLGGLKESMRFGDDNWLRDALPKDWS